ncbi:MAG: hypothetical protein AAF532_10585 [Planctomycetota bacterium]
MSDRDARRRTADEIYEIVEEGCDRPLGPEATARLEELLRRDVTAIQDFLGYVDVHASLLAVSATDGPSAVAERIARGVRPAVSRDRNVWRARAAVALTVVAMAGVAAWAPLGLRPAGQPVGRVVALSDGAVWEGDPFAIDDVVGRGDRLALEKGFVTVELADDVVVDLVGPVATSFQPRSVWLSRGFLTGRVGPDGRGFAVRTEDARVVDLGTEFEVHKDYAYGTQVRVLSGHVEATLRDADGEDTKVFDLLAGQAARLDRNSPDDDPQGVIFDFDAVARVVRGAKGKVRRFAGAAKPLSGPVVGLDFRSGVYETAANVLVVPERTGVTLDRPLPLADGSVLEAGVRFDSYLLHFDVGRGSFTGVAGRGSIRFDGSVAAVVTDSADLAATDGPFATAGSVFEPADFRGVDDEDAVRLDAVDGGTVVAFDLNVTAGRALDQFRVLVPSRP